MKKRILYACSIVTIITFNIILFSLFIFPLKAILDGRTAPIHVDVVYSFTNGEWARGSVFFQNGFDLPVGGTVYLGIDGGFVNGPINLNGGTLTLEKQLLIKNNGSIVASGFIRGTPGSPDSLFICYEGTELWSGTGTVKIIQTGMAFQGVSSTMDNRNITIDLREAGSDIYFLGGKINLRNWLTSETTPARLWFVDTDIITTNDFSNFNTNEIYFEGNVSLATLNPVIFKNIFLQEFTKMIISSGSEISLHQISLPYRGTRLEVQQSSLDFTSTTTALLRMITPYAHNNQGTLAFDGNCKISSSTNNTLVFDKYANIEILSGAHLKLTQGTYFLIE